MTLYKSHEDEPTNGCSCDSNCTCASNWIDPNNLGVITYLQGIDCNGCEAFQPPDELIIPVDLCTLAVPAGTIANVAGLSADDCMVSEGAAAFVQTHETPPTIIPLAGLTAIPTDGNPHEWTIGLDWCATAIESGMINTIVGVSDDGCVRQQLAGEVVTANQDRPTITGENGIIATPDPTNPNAITISVDWCVFGVAIPAGEIDKFVGRDVNNCLVAGAAKDVVCEAIKCFDLGLATEAGAREYIGADCKRYPFPETPEQVPPTIIPGTPGEPGQDGGNGIVIITDPDDPNSFLISIDWCVAGASIPAGTITQLVGLDENDCVVVDNLVDEGGGGGGGAASFLLCQAIATMPTGPADSTLYVGQDCRLHPLPEVDLSGIHPALTVIEGDVFSFDDAAQSLVVQRGKQRFDGDMFPAGAIDGDILVSDAGTPCEKRFIMCDGVPIFVSATSSEAAAIDGVLVGNAAVSLPANATIQTPPFTTIIYDTHADQGGTGLILPGTNVVQAIECCSFIITAGIELGDTIPGDTYSIDLIRTDPGGGSFSISGDSDTSIDGGFMVLQTTATQAGVPGSTYALEVTSESGESVLINTWFADITSQNCEPEIVL